MYRRNPFFVGGPVPIEHFKGRERAFNAAVDQVLNSGHLALYGEPGIGKSSLLRYLAAPQGWQARGQDTSSMIFVSLNCTTINPFSPDAFWREILNQLKGTNYPIVLEEGSSGSRRELGQFLNVIGPQGKRLILLLDDYDQVLKANSDYTEAEMLSFLYELRSLAVADQAGRYLSMIVSTFRRLDELGPRSTLPSPWYNHYLFRPLKPFAPNEVNVLLDAMPEEWALTEEHRAGLREICGGHPALLQNACRLIFDRLQDEEKPGLDTKQFTSDFISATEHFFNNTWKSSSESEQMLMMLIALSNLDGRLNHKRSYNLSDVDIILSQLDRELRVLEERGILNRREEDGKVLYSFGSSIMEWWVIKEIENSADETELNQRERVFLSLSRKQADQIKGVMRQVWQYRDAVQSIAGWTGKLVGAFGKGVAGGG